MEDRPQSSETAPGRSIRHRLEAWAGSLAGPLEGHLSWTASGAAELERGGLPDWLAAPGWLLEAWGEEGVLDPGASATFLADLQWSQTCLFLAVRILDDQMDGAGVAEQLAPAPTLLLNEAHRSLRPHFKRESPFWKVLRQNLKGTLTAMLELDSLQKKPGAMQARHLEIYAGQSRILDVAAAAVAIKLDRSDMERRLLEQILGEISIVDQLLDDLEDLDEDLEAGRFTYAANLLLGLQAGSSTPLPNLETLSAPSLLRSGPLKDLITRCDQHLEEAAAAAARLAVPRIQAELRELHLHLQAAAREIHRQRVLRSFRAARAARRGG